MSNTTSALVLIIVGLCVFCLLEALQIQDIVESHHVYVRQTELRQAAIETRLETLERVGIEIELKQRDGIWLVTETKGK